MLKYDNPKPRIIHKKRLDWERPKFIDKLIPKRKITKESIAEKLKEKAVTEKIIQKEPAEV